MFFAMTLMILGLVRLAKSDQRMAEMKLTKELIFLVKNSGGTIKELAAKLAVSESTVRRVRRSRRFVTI